MKWDEIHNGFLLKAMNSVLKKLTSGKILNFKVQVVIEKCEIYYRGIHYIVKILI